MPNQKFPNGWIFTSILLTCVYAADGDDLDISIYFILKKMMWHLRIYFLLLSCNTTYDKRLWPSVMLVIFTMRYLDCKRSEYGEAAILPSFVSELLLTSWHITHRKPCRRTPFPSDTNRNMHGQLIITSVEQDDYRLVEFFFYRATHWRTVCNRGVYAIVILPDCPPTTLKL